MEDTLNYDSLNNMYIYNINNRPIPKVLSSEEEEIYIFR